MPINNLGLRGQPILPYVDSRSYAGADVYLDLTFLDHMGVGQIPTSLTYQMDDMTNSLNMIPPTTVNPPGYQMTLQIPGSQMQMTHVWQGSQVCQILMTSVLSDGSTIKGVAIIELCSIQTPGGF